MNPETFEPGSLLAGKAAGFHLDVLDCLFKGAAGVEGGDQLLVPECFSRLHSEAARAVQKPNFLHQAGLDHGTNAGVDAPIDRLNGPVQPEQQHIGAACGRGPLRFRRVAVRRTRMLSACDQSDVPHPHQ